MPQHEGNACVEVTQGQSSEGRAFPELCSRLCDVPLPTTSTGDAYFFWPLLRPPIQISRCGLSALPRDMNLSGIRDAQYPYAGVLAHAKQELIKRIEGASATPSVIERKPWT